MTRRTTRPTSKKQPTRTNSTPTSITSYFSPSNFLHASTITTTNNVIPSHSITPTSTTTFDITTTTTATTATATTSSSTFNTTINTTTTTNSTATTIFTTYTTTTTTSTTTTNNTPSSSTSNPSSSFNTSRHSLLQSTLPYRIDASSAYAPPLNFPTFSYVTFNCTSLSAYSEDSYASTRRSTIHSILRSLSNYDIIGLQECKLLPKDYHSLTGIFTQHTPFYNNNSSSHEKLSSISAGTITWIRSSILYDSASNPDGWYPTNHNLIPGRVQYTSLQSHNTILTITNVYLDAHSNTQRLSQLHTIKTSVPTSSFNILLGDFNFVESERDRSGSGFVPNEKLLDSFRSLLDKFKLQEIHQDSHTYWFSGRDGTHRSARLDRIYASYNLAQRSISTPTAYTITKQLHNRTYYNLHLPLVVSFSNKPSQTTRPRNHFSQSIFADPLFSSHFPAIFEASDRNVNPLKRYITSIIKCYHVVSKIIRKTRTTIPLQAAINALHALSQPKPDIRNFDSITRQRHTKPIRHLVHPIYNDDGVTFDTSKLSDFINDYFIIHDQHLSNTDDSFNPSQQSSVDNDFPSLPTGPSKKPKNSYVKTLKSLLPTSRSKITHLRPHHTADPTDDPSIISATISHFYSDIWKRGDDDESIIDNYLSTYPRRINAQLINKPTLDSISNVINSSGDTAPGPDGIPFIAFRVTCSFAAPALLWACLDICSESPTLSLKEFNQSILHLIPKRATQLIEDTRPISVANTYNRIIARALSTSIMPAVDSFLDHTQKGFIIGRSMSDHIHTLNDIFYRSWKSDDPYFVLFTDNKRAFDSIHHSFIKSTLSKQGFPNWFLMAVSNLLSDVVVSPFLCPDLNIPILRGVKQGCPLSPLLFVLTYDTLIHQLKQIPGATPLAAADDLALGSTHIDTVTNTFPLIDAFTIASGMGINIGKSGILPSSTKLQKDPDIISAINRSAWPNVKLLSEQKYLGIIFSNNPDSSITINKSFDIALKKFSDRANLFKAAFSKMDLRRRVSAFNIFLASLFSYVIGFYLPPRHVYHAFKSIASWLIIPYSGTGYIYEYLVVPGKNGGSPFSVQDLFVSAMLRLVSATDVTSYIKDKSTRPWPLNSKDACLSRIELEAYHRDHRFLKSTPLISDHRQLAAMDFISKNYLNVDDNAPLNGPALSLSLTKPRIKEILIDRGFTKHTRFTEHFISKLNYWSCPEHPSTSPISVIYDRLPLSFRVNYFRLFTNSAATNSRTRFFTNEALPSHPNPFPCLLCDSLSDSNPDSEEKGTDRLQHIFVPSHCSAVWDALTLFLAEGVISTRLFNSLSSLSWPLFLLRFPSDINHFQKDSVFVLSLCYAIWRTRSLLCKGLTGNAGDIIFKQTMRFADLWDPENTSRPTPRSRSIYGNAGRRDDVQSFRALDDTKRLIASAPTSTCLIFTDGASRGNPGPAGASAVFYAPGSSRPFSAAFKYIGRNTNNIAEVTAIKIALIASRQWIRSILTTLPSRSQVDKLNLLILTDSKLIYALVSKKKFGKSPPINESLNVIYDILNSWITPKVPIIRWIPGHSNFPGNNAADDFANHAVDHPDSAEIPSLGFSTFNLNSPTFSIRPSWILPAPAGCG